MAKDGKRARWREAGEPLPDVDEYLFGNGLSVSDYSLSAEGVVSFKDKAGREFDLLIDHPRLEAAIKERLETLGAKEAF
ncbi:hypothetical protein EEB18_016050 [Sphingopyxis sp. OPL5]|uniref:hypothetical protein n=1 Tax=Sphingopyxis sp. OPL5 TaxID=2486273 RepID=UPI00164DB971|nr:hypothetical protein [Sphingopyxis sp. OPL5]QNO26272.1 hypothetical protein EEB18_016050 [Sphingopyxis sp. OPL5]